MQQAPHHWCHKLWPSHDRSCHSSTYIHPLVACQCLPPCHYGGGKPCCVWCMFLWLLSCWALCHGVLYCPSYPGHKHLKLTSTTKSTGGLGTACCLSIQVTYGMQGNAKQYMSTTAVPRKQHKHPPHTQTAMVQQSEGPWKQAQRSPLYLGNTGREKRAAGPQWLQLLPESTRQHLATAAQGLFESKPRPNHNAEYAESCASRTPTRSTYDMCCKNEAPRWQCLPCTAD
jgi:hypothetical protein